MTKSLDLDEIESRPILDDISVVIPTLGRPILEESLYWILRGSAWPRDLIVVDQGINSAVETLMSTIGTVGIQAVYLPSQQRGRAAGINRGLERVQTRFVAITDDDCFVERDWLMNMAAHLRTYPESIVTGRVEAGSEDVIVVVTSPVPSVQYRPKLTFDHMSGGNVGTSAKVLDRVGLFDEHPSVRTAEDGEWAYRALRAGISIHYRPDICVRHFGWRDETQRMRQYQDYARSHGGFYGKYLRRGDWFIALRALLHHLRALRRWLKGQLNRDQDAREFGWAYLTGLMPGIVAGLRRGKS
jgi:GT2 family glycosyltransferase